MRQHTSEVKLEKKRNNQEKKEKGKLPDTNITFGQLAKWVNAYERVEHANAQSLTPYLKNTLTSATEALSKRNLGG